MCKKERESTLFQDFDIVAEKNTINNKSVRTGARDVEDGVGDTECNSTWRDGERESEREQGTRRQEERGEM